MKLTKREKEVLKLTAWDCLSAKEVGDQLNISTITVQNHIHNIKIKENVSKITELSKLYFIKYIKIAGAPIILLLLSLSISSTSEHQVRTRRTRRRYNTEFSKYQYSNTNYITAL